MKQSFWALSLMAASLRNHRLAVAWRIGIIVLAGAAALAPVPSVAIETYYSTFAYPGIQRLLTAISNHVPFALFDLLLLTVAAWWTWRLARDAAGYGRARWPRAMATVVGRTATTAAALYIAFLLLWGLNYRREPLVERLQFDAARVSRDRVREITRETVDRLNELYPAAASARQSRDVAAGVDRALAAAFHRTLDQLGLPAGTMPGVPKRTLLDPYFRRAGVAGMTDPYFLETLISTDLLLFERPAVIAHEWSHLAGIADEGEANFTGWLTCVKASPDHQYSGWLFLYGELTQTLSRADVDAEARRLLPGPQRDLLAVRDRLLRHVNPQVSAAGWRVYDGYLKANRIEEGAASYADVVRLVLGVHFDSDWTPGRARKRF